MLTYRSSGVAMTGWRVEPSAVSALVDGVRASSSVLTGTLDQLGPDIESAADGTASADVSTALSAFVESHAAGITLVKVRPGQAADAVVNATNAITTGDEEMADLIQSEAASTWTADSGVVRGHGTGMR